MKKLVTYLLLAVLMGSFAVVSCTSDIKADIDNTDEKVESLQTQIKNLETALQAYKNEVNPKLAAQNEQIQANLAALTAADEALENALKKAVTNEALTAAISDFEKALAKIKEDQKVVDSNQDLALENLTAQVGTYKKAIEEALGNLDKKVDENLKTAKAYTDALQIAVKATTDALENRIKANEDAIKKIDEETIPALDKAIKALQEGKLDKATYDAFKQDYLTWKGTIDGDIVDINGLITNLQTQVASLEAVVEALDGDTEGAIAKIYTHISDAIAAATKDLEAKIDTINGDEETEGSIAYAVKVLNDKLQEAIDKLAGRVTALEEELEKLQASIKAMNDSLINQIQSLVFVPEYQDMRFGIPFSVVTENVDNPKFLAIEYNPVADPNDEESVPGFPVVYKVAPAELAADIAKAVNQAVEAKAEPLFTFDIESGLQGPRTKTSELNPAQLIILHAEADPSESGKIRLWLEHHGFQVSLGKTDQPALDSYAVSLRADNDETGTHIISGYTQTILAPSELITIDMKSLYKEEKDAVKKAYDLENPYEHTIQYVDTVTYHPYDSCFLAATLQLGTGPVQGPYSFETIRKMGYDLPKASLKVTETATKCPVIHPTLKDSVVAAVKLVPTDATATKKLKNIKDHFVATPKDSTILNYAYSDGIGGTMNIPAQEKVVKVEALKFKVTYDMKWDYLLDKDADHENMDKTADFVPYDRKVYAATPKLVRKVNGVEKEFALDGSDDAYGIVASDFKDLKFAKAASSEVPERIQKYSFDVKASDDTKGTISLDSLIIKDWGVVPAEGGVKKSAQTISGSYELAFSDKSDADVIINTADRNRSEINYTLETFPVTILGGSSQTVGGTYDKEKDCYVFKSANLATDIYNKYVEQGIITDKTLYPQKLAFADEEKSEFHKNNVKWLNNETSTDDERFETSIVNNTNGGELSLKSRLDTAKAKTVSSAVLKAMAQNYDGGAEKSFKFSFRTYIGQVVNLTWAVTANTKEPYKFATYGAQRTEKGEAYFDIAPNLVWVPNLNAIEKASTEIDLIWNQNIQVVTGAGGEGGIKPADFKVRGIVPVVSLVSTEAIPGVEVAKDSLYASNLKFYSRVDSVALKTQMYVQSGDTQFLVPDSDKIFFNNTTETLESVLVNKYNPVAAAQTTEAQAIIAAGSTGTLPFDLVDRNGNSIYKNGVAQNEKGNYKSTIAKIFGDIKLSLVSVDGEETFTGWAISEAATPEKAQLTIPAGEPAVHTVVVKVETVWENYEYTFKVWTGPAEGAVNAFNSDYGKGGDATWK